MVAEPIRVLLADDHPLVRSGLQVSLSAEKDLQVVGEAENGDDAQRLAQELRPDVLLLDYRMPGPAAVDTVRFVAEYCPGVKVLILTAYDREDYVRNLTKAGVSGYVIKDEAMEALAEAIRTVNGGGTWFSRGVISKLAQQEEARNAFDLTEREQDVLSAVARGWNNARIAEHFALSQQTVRNYVSRIYEKLGVRSRAEAIIWVQDNGFAGRDS